MVLVLIPSLLLSWVSGGAWGDCSSPWGRFSAYEDLVRNMGAQGNATTQYLNLQSCVHSERSYESPLPEEEVCYSRLLSGRDEVFDENPVLDSEASEDVSVPSEIASSVELAQAAGNWDRSPNVQKAVDQSVRRVLERFPPGLRRNIQVAQYARGSLGNTEAMNVRSLLFKIPRPWGYQYVFYDLDGRDDNQAVAVYSVRTRRLQGGRWQEVPPVSVALDYRREIRTVAELTPLMSYRPSDCLVCHTRGLPNPLRLRTALGFRSIWPRVGQPAERWIEQFNASIPTQTAGAHFAGLPSFSASEQNAFFDRAPDDTFLRRCTEGSGVDPQRIRSAMNSCVNCHNGSTRPVLSMADHNWASRLIRQKEMPPSGFFRSTDSESDRQSLAEVLSSCFDGFYYGIPVTPETPGTPAAPAIPGRLQRYLSEANCSALRTRLALEANSCPAPDSSPADTGTLDIVLRASQAVRSVAGEAGSCSFGR